MSPALEAQSLNLWTTTEVPPLVSENLEGLGQGLRGRAKPGALLPTPPLPSCAFKAAPSLVRRRRECILWGVSSWTQESFVLCAWPAEASISTLETRYLCSLNHFKEQLFRGGWGGVLLLVIASRGTEVT